MAENYRTGNEINISYRNSVEYNQKSFMENRKIDFSGFESDGPPYGQWQGLDSH